MTSSQKDTYFTARRAEYICRINRVIDYIDANIDRELSLAALAEVACFSQFHFHRIFKAISGETLHQFIQRLRIEKAAAQLIHSPEKPISDIAVDCGFSSSAAFARAFKGRFQLNASSWRASQLQKSKICQTKSRIWQDFAPSSYYIASETDTFSSGKQAKENRHVQIEVKEMPQFHVAYVRHTGPYQGDSELFAELFNKLMNWAEPRGLLHFPETTVMSVYHDSPAITEEDRLRISACITVPEETAVTGEIGKMRIDGGKFAVATFTITASAEYEKAWNLVFSEWLPEYGYQPDDRLCYEIYRSSPQQDPAGRHIVDICLPVKPL